MATRRTSRFAEARRRRAAGFTLIELLVVLAIIAALAAFAIPAGRNALPGLVLKRAAEGLASEARRARAEAIHRAREGWIEIDLDGRRYRRAGGGWASFPAEIGLELETAESELDGAARGRIRFHPDGASTGGRALLSGNGAGYAVSVDWLDGAVSVAAVRAGP